MFIGNRDLGIIRMEDLLGQILFFRDQLICLVYRLELFFRKIWLRIFLVDVDFNDVGIWSCYLLFRLLVVLLWFWNREGLQLCYLYIIEYFWSRYNDYLLN